MDSGLGDVPPPVGFDGGRRREECGFTEVQRSSPYILLFDLPRLTVELSRLELVVLADILAGFAQPSDNAALGGSSKDYPQPDVSPPTPLEVVVDVCGATIVLHEAAAFAEDPGPHSFFLNLGNASVHLGGSETSVEGSPAPLVTVSSGDVGVHETLRRSLDDGSGLSGGGRITGPLLFLPGQSVSAYPSLEDLPALGFVSGNGPPTIFSSSCIRL